MTRWLVIVGLAACGSSAPVPAVVAPSGRRVAPVPETLACLDAPDVLIDRGGHRLWRGDCANLAAPATLVATSATTTFIGGRRTPDGKRLLYEDAGGIAEVELATGATRLVFATPPGHIKRCRPEPAVAGGPKLAPGTWVDHIVGFADADTTLVLRRAPFLCASPSAYEVRIANFADPVKASAHAAHPIYDVAAVGTSLIMLDGGGVWRSTDRGQTWHASTPLGLVGAPMQIATDAKAHTLVIRTTAGQASVAPHTTSDGALFINKDDRGPWTRLVTPLDPAHPAGVGWLSAPAPGAWVIGSDVLLDGTPASSGDHDKLEQRAWTSKDGGKKWQATTATPPARPYAATLGDDRFEATDDGVVRVTGGVRTVVTETRQEPYALDVF